MNESFEISLLIRENDSCMVGSVKISGRKLIMVINPLDVSKLVTCYT